MELKILKLYFNISSQQKKEYATKYCLIFWPPICFFKLGSHPFAEKETCMLLSRQKCLPFIDIAHKFEVNNSAIFGVIFFSSPENRLLPFGKKETCNVTFFTKGPPIL